MPADFVPTSGIRFCEEDVQQQTNLQHIALQLNPLTAPLCSRRLEHVPEKWKPIFRKGHATTKKSRPFPDSTESGNGLVASARRKRRLARRRLGGDAARMIQSAQRSRRY